jgi:4a-hydroxytetrahydrobiopterin dehydratase
LENKAPLTDEQIDTEIEQLEGWSRDGKFLKKDFVFANFKEINRFLPHLTASVVSQNHHPDFSFISGEKKVSIEVTTHSEGGLTQADLNLARALNDWNN